MALYINDAPLVACLIMVALVVFTALSFKFYDYLVNQEVVHKDQLMQSKRQYVRYISHEIRTPLNVVHLGFQMLYSEMNKLLKGSEMLHELSSVTLLDWISLVQDIVESTNAAISVLNDLIDYDKIDSGTMTLQLEPLPIVKFVEQTVHPFIVQARAKDINLDIVLHSSIQIQFNHHVMGDRVKLGQVLRNLVSNALKFTPAGGNVRVEIKSVQLENQEGLMKLGNIVINVTDTGAGMSKSQLKQLFHEGVQFNPNDLQAGQGSGLGLCIAKGIVDTHGGKLQAFSEGEGKGTTFSLTMPVHSMKDIATSSPHGDIQTCKDKEEEDFNDVEGSRHSGTTNAAPTQEDSIKEIESMNTSLLVQSQQSTRFPNILVTDDSAVNRKMMCRSLESVGFKCFQASDGQDCLDIIHRVIRNEHENIDIILMDFEMPRMNGPYATSAIRSIPCDIPVIGVTGNVLNEDKRLFIDHGAANVIQKPFSMTQLEEVLRHLPSKLVV